MPERRLNTAQDVRRYLANLINRVEAGKIEEGRAKTLTYMLSLLVRTIEGGDLEKRIEEIERRLQNGLKTSSQAD